MGFDGKTSRQDLEADWNLADLFTVHLDEDILSLFGRRRDLYCLAAYQVDFGVGEVRAGVQTPYCAEELQQFHALDAVSYTHLTLPTTPYV